MWEKEIPLYDYRRMTAEEREWGVLCRKEQGYPRHSPPHGMQVEANFLITAACFEHKSIVDGPKLLSWLQEEILSALVEGSVEYHAYVFQPTHYHVLLHALDLAIVSEILRKKHSDLATKVNGQQDARGRRVWYRYSDRRIRDERHFWTTVNYIHFNPVKHGYVDTMSVWPWSSWRLYLEEHGQQWLEELWVGFPVANYGKGWDWK